MVIYHRIKESILAVEKDYSKLFGRSWTRLLSDPLLTTEYMDNLQCYISEAYKATNFIYPKAQEDIFKALRLTKADNIRVVIFGNEPAPSHYSNGLAFGAYKSTIGNYNNSLKCSKDIKNCLDPDDLEDFGDFDTTLLSWAEQGVLLLNTSLISEYGNIMKHEYYFRNLIREVIKCVNEVNVDVVFVFTDSLQSEKFERYVDTDFNTVLHYDGIDPDSSMFEDINQILETNGGKSNMIEW